MPDYPKHLSGFSYVGRHRYSLTFCTFQRRPLFTDAAIVNLAWEAFLRAGHDQTMAIIAACFMPDHVHVVGEGRSQGSDALAFISSAKQGSGYRYAQQNEGRRLWQRYGFERVLRDEESTQAVVRYVLENPVRKGLVAHPAQYPFIRSSEYTIEELIEFAYDGTPSRRS